MSRIGYRRILYIGLAWIVIIGLCGCGKQKESDFPGVENSIAGNAKSDLAKENVYRVRSKEIMPWADCEDPFLSVWNAVCMEEGFCAVLEMRDRLADRGYYGILKTDKSLSDFAVIPLELPEEIREVSTEEGDGEEAEWEEISYSRITIAPDQKIFGLRNVTRSYEEPDTGEYCEEQERQICCWNMAGKLSWTTEWTDWKDADAASQGFRVRGIFAAADGSAELLFCMDREYKVHIGSDGTLSKKEPLSDRTQKVFSAYCGIWPKGDGTWQVLFSDDREKQKAYLARYDIRTDTWEESYELPIPYTRFLWGMSVSAGTEHDLIYANEDGIWSYQKGDEQERLRMNYVNSDMDITGMEAVLEPDADHFFAVYREAGTGTMQAGIFTYVKPEDVADRQVIVLGGACVDEGMRKQVVALNRSNDTYRVVLKTYDYDENSHSFPGLNLDIASGNMPDILIAQQLPVESLIRKGLIADIRPLIEQDAELSEKEWMQNVFDAYSVDGMWVYLVPDFAVRTMVAKTSLVGDKSDWTLEKAKQVLAGMEGTPSLMSEITRERFMEEAMLFWGRNFEDPETGKCAFTSDDFIELMEFAATLPDDANAEYDEDYWDEYEAQYRDNKTLLMELNLFHLQASVSYELNGYMGEDYTFVGFPGISEKAGDPAAKGAYLYSDHLMVLSENGNPDGAWAFARYYLTDEYQNSLVWSLPVNRKILTERAKELTQPQYYFDENGEKAEWVDYIYYHGEDIPIPQMSQQQADALIAYAASVREIGFTDTDVMNIVFEEMESYFSGQKSAKDAAAVIQNRAQLLLEEKR